MKEKADQSWVQRKRLFPALRHLNSAAQSGHHEAFSRNLESPSITGAILPNQVREA